MNERIIDKLAPESAERIATLELLLDRVGVGPLNELKAVQETKTTGWVMPKRGDMLKIVGDSNSHGFPLGTFVEFHYCLTCCYGASAEMRTAFWVAKGSGDQRSIAPEDCAPVS